MVTPRQRSKPRPVKPEPKPAPPKRGGIVGPVTPGPLMGVKPKGAASFLGLRGRIGAGSVLARPIPGKTPGPRKPTGRPVAK